MNTPAGTEWEQLRDRIESIIHSYAVNHYNSPEGDWRGRRRVRNMALDDLIDLFKITLLTHHQQETERKVLAARKEEVAHWSKMRDKWRRGARAEAAADILRQRGWPSDYNSLTRMETKANAIISENSNK